MADKEILGNLNDLITALAVAADESEDEHIEEVVDTALLDAMGTLTSAVRKVGEYTLDKYSLISSKSLEEMTILASEFDKSGDPLLQKQAAVLDEILLTIGANKKTVSEAKSAQDLEVAKIKAARDESEPKSKDPYTMVKAEHDKQNRVEEARKMIADKVKEYRPLEAPLMTRTCPDHPGAQMSRIAEGTFQCSLDKGIYNYQSGFTTMKGNRIPGGDVSNQTQALHDRPNEFTSFDSRESKLNNQ